MDTLGPLLVIILLIIGAFALISLAKAGPRKNVVMHSNNFDIFLTTAVTKLQAKNKSSLVPTIPSNITFETIKDDNYDWLKYCCYVRDGCLNIIPDVDSVINGAKCKKEALVYQKNEDISRAGSSAKENEMLFTQTLCYIA